VKPSLFMGIVCLFRQYLTRELI